MITEKTKRLIDEYAAIRFRRSKDVPLDVRDPLQPGKYFFGYEVTAKSIEKAEIQARQIASLEEENSSFKEQAEIQVGQIASLENSIDYAETKPKLHAQREIEDIGSPGKFIKGVNVKESCVEKSR